MIEALECDKFWVDKIAYADAERQYYEGLAKLPNCKGLVGNTDGTNPQLSEALGSPKCFVAAKKISISESDNKENTNVSPDTPKSNIKKIKSQKCILSGDESEWITVCSKSELKENSKRNRKNKELNSPSVLNKDASSSPPTSPKEDAIVASAEQPAEACPKQQQQKTKESKEKPSKAEKKKNNKKDKAEVKMTEDKPQVVEKTEDSPVPVVAECVVEKQGGSSSQVISGQCSLSHEIAKARQHIKNSLECMDTVMASVPSVEVISRISTLEAAMEDLRSLVLRIQEDVNKLAKNIPTTASAPAVCPAKPPQAKSAPPKDDSDDGVDLFASDSEDDEAASKIREERLAAYAAKKSKKPALIAKSSIILDVKPWDDETDMNKMEEEVRKIQMEGLLWGASKFVLLAYGIKKLQINCVVEDEKVSVDLLQEEIEKIEDLVQSVDIAAFNKI